MNRILKFLLLKIIGVVNYGFLKFNNSRKSFIGLIVSFILLIV